MIPEIPFYVSISFIFTTFLTIGFLFYAIKQSVGETFPAKLLIGLTAFWIFFTGVLAIGGFYLKTHSNPPTFIFLPLPPLLLILIYFIFFRADFIEKLPLKILTLLSVVRIPVEIVLFWLYQNDLVPKVMTFEGRNFDILAGITAPLIYFLAFRKDRINKPVLLIWFFISFLLLINIVTTAVLSLPTNFQQLGLEQPNRAVLYFPYIWLPGIIVPIVLFSHLTAFWQILIKKR